MASIYEEFAYIIASLKRKIMLISAVIIAGFCVSYPLLDPLIVKIKEDLLPEGVKLIYIYPVEVIMVKVKISFFIGMMFGTPIVCYYVYKTLKVRFGIRNPMKKTHLIILLCSAISLFLLGVSYSYFLMLPLVLKYLYMDALAAGAIATYSIHEFIFFVIILTLILGISFELPIVLVFVVHSGLVQIDTLKEYRRYIIVAMFVLAAIFTPPDVVSQLMVAFPLIICYEIGIIVASFVAKRQSVKHPLRA
jgi:sec-independent protein translocase protein TatC